MINSFKSALLPPRYVTHTVMAMAAIIFSSLLAPPLHAESEGAFAARVCGIFEATAANSTFGAGSGCTWTIGHGDVGETATEIGMMSFRGLSPAEIAKIVGDYDELFEKMNIIAGYRLKNIDINCETTGAPAKMIFWGVPSKSNIVGFAVCGNNIIYGDIHTPPDSSMDTEAVFIDLMKKTSRLTN